MLKTVHFVVHVLAHITAHILCVQKTPSYRARSQSSCR